MMSATIAAMLFVLQNKPIPQDIDIRSRIEIAAVNNQIPPDRMLALMECESGGNPKAWNKNDPGKYGSRGLYQYQTNTFYDNAKIYGFEKPDIWDINQQILLTAYLLAQNKWNLWSCSKKIDISV